MSFLTPSVQTVGVQTAQMPFAVGVPEDCAGIINIFIVATDHGANLAGWFIRQAFRRPTGGDVVAPAGVQNVFHPASVGAATWAAAVRADGGNLVVDVTGGIGQTVDWMGTSDEPIGSVGPFTGQV